MERVNPALIPALIPTLIALPSRFEPAHTDIFMILLPDNDISGSFTE